MKSKRVAIALIAMGLATLFIGCAYKRPPWIAAKCIKGPFAKAGAVKDEAQCVNRSAESFPGADEDYFKDMDYGISQDPQKVVATLEPFVPGISGAPEEAVKAIVRGRNNWIVWTGGDDKFWDHLNINSQGSFRVAP